jgi:PBP1b-binding outer membrane lipoprotein LpoB
MSLTTYLNIYNTMEKTIKKNFTTIVMFMAIAVFFRGCSHKRDIQRIETNIETTTTNYNTIVEKLLVIENVMINNERHRTLDATISALTGIKNESERDAIIREKKSLQDEIKILRDQLETLNMIIKQNSIK